MFNIERERERAARAADLSTQSNIREPLKNELQTHTRLERAEKLSLVRERAVHVSEHRDTTRALPCKCNSWQLVLVLNAHTRRDRSARSGQLSIQCF